MPGSGFNDVTMKKFNLVFHLIHILFLIISVGIVFKREELSDFFGLKTLDYAVYWIILGLVLYFILWIKDVLDTFNLKRKLRNMEAEKNKYKAELYDNSASKTLENGSESLDLDNPASDTPNPAQDPPIN